MPGLVVNRTEQEQQQTAKAAGAKCAHLQLSIAPSCSVAAAA